MNRSAPSGFHSGLRLAFLAALGMPALSVRAGSPEGPAPELRLRFGPVPAEGVLTVPLSSPAPGLRYQSLERCARPGPLPGPPLDPALIRELRASQLAGGKPVFGVKVTVRAAGGRDEGDRGEVIGNRWKLNSERVFD